MKFSVAHPSPGKRRTENFTKISRQISRHLWQRKTEKYFTSALLQGSCSDIFYFFFLFFGAGEREEASEEVAGRGPDFNKSRGRGGVFPKRRPGSGKGAGGMSMGRGGELNIFFPGKKRPPSKQLRQCYRYNPGGHLKKGRSSAQEKCRKSASESAGPKRGVSRKVPKKVLRVLGLCRGSTVHAQYDWTTGVPDNGNDWRKFRAVPRSHPLRSLVLYFV